MTDEILVGATVIRAELEPFEVDLLHKKLSEAAGKVVRVLSDDKYEVLWTWPNGETCLAHHPRRKLISLDHNTLRFFEH